VITSGPAVSVDEQELYAGLTGQGATAPSKARIDEQLANAQPSGFDPRPDLASLSIPTLWLFGAEDKAVYVPQTVGVLEGLPTRPAIRVFPRAGHFVLDPPHGLSSEIPRAHRFAPGLFATISGWLATH
jgi:pimeloyl-ACP methyl ester carboxylesterase